MLSKWTFRHLALTSNRRFVIMRCYSSGTRNEAPFLLTPQELKQVAVSTAPEGQEKSSIVLLDASWHMPNSPRNAREEFTRKRLPGARFLDLDEVASPHELGLKHMIPSAEHFAWACSSFGIKPNTHVVLYDSHGIFSAPRALFMFRAFGHANSSILDGGLPRWEAEGLPLENNARSNDAVSTAFASAVMQPTDPLGYPAPALDADVVKSYEQMVSNAERDPSVDPTAALVIDARSTGRFTGKDPEPRPGLSSGHIPYSSSLPFTAFLQTHHIQAAVSVPSTYTTFRPPSEIRSALLSALGGSEKDVQDVLSGRRAIITSCGSGMTAGVLWVGLRMLGVQKPALYDESWSGYAARASSKIIQEQ